MKAVSLFSGVGGFEIGFDRAGIETVLQCEIDPVAQSVLRRHWPETERISDVRNVGRGHGGSIDLVYGGFPCQDLSVAGKRTGLGGERSGLWFEFHRVLRELRPRWAVIENVPGLLSSNQGRDFGIVLAGLEELGFGGISWAVLDAQNFGVPQRRRRVFIVAGPSRRACEQVLSLCESCGGDASADGAPGQDAASPLEKSPASVGGQLYIADIIGPLSDGAHRGGGLNGQDVYFGRILAQDAGVRRLTPLECERVMGWPDDWTRYDDKGKHILDSHRYRLCGNGVVATVAEWLGRRLVEVDRNDHHCRGFDPQWPWEG